MEDQRKGQTTATDLAEAEAEGEEEHRMYENVWKDDLQREWRARTAILWIEGETNREITHTNTLQHHVNSNQLKGKEPKTKTKKRKHT